MKHSSEHFQVKRYGLKGPYCVSHWPHDSFHDEILFFFALSFVFTFENFFLGGKGATGTGVEVSGQGDGWDQNA